MVRCLHVAYVTFRIKTNFNHLTSRFIDVGTMPLCQLKEI